MKKEQISEDREAKVKMGWYVSPKVKDAFLEFCKSSGIITQDAAAGALLCWMHLSPDIQRVAIKKANGSEDIDLQAYFPEAIKPGSSRAEQVAALIHEFQRLAQLPQSQNPKIAPKGGKTSPGGV